MESVNFSGLINSGEQSFSEHEQLTAFLENIPKIIYIKDSKGNYVAGTKHASEFMNNGYDVIRNIKFDIKSVQSENMKEDKYVLENDNKIVTGRVVYDVNGIVHWYTVYKVPVHDEKAKVVGLVVMVDNNDDARMLEEQRSTFVASVGHDLKNPTLAQIRAIELLLKGQFGEIPDAQREILEMVLDSCKYMNAMLASFLATYRYEHGVVTLNYEQISLTDLVKECIGEMLYYAKDKELAVRFDDDIDGMLVYGDKVQIKRVIMNLLSNGIKYAYKNTELNVISYHNGENVGFKFENRSPYIPPEKQKLVFDQYVSFAESHNELGIGLGLYTSQKIVEAHNGKIFVESHKDEKNVFGFEIPSNPSDMDTPRTVTF